MTSTAVLFGGQANRWISGTTYPLDLIVLSPISRHYYTRIIAGAGTTDPSADPTNWTPVGATGVKSIQRGVVTVTTSPATATISPAVDVSKSTLRFLGSSGTDGVRLELTNSTTITAYKSTSIGPAPDVSWELEEKW